MNPEFKPIPFLKFPAVPRTKILHLLETADLFDLSLCSKKMTQMVKDTRTLASSHKILFKASASLIEVKFLNERKWLWFDFGRTQSRDQMKDQRKVGKVFLYYVQKSYSEPGPMNTFYVCYPDNVRGMAEVSKHLVNLFPGPVDLEFSTSYNKNIATVFGYEHCQQLESLRICGGVIMKELMKQIFEEITIRRKLVVKPDIDDEYMILEALKVEDLHLSNAYSWTSAHLLQMECRFVLLQKHYFSLKHVEAFAKHWLESPDSKIEWVRLGWSDQPRILSFESLKTKKWDRKQREMMYLYSYENVPTRLDCSNGFDIDKENGDLATIVIARGELYFLVWNERFPEKKRMEKLPEVLKPYYKQLEDLEKEYDDSCSLERLLANPSLRIEEFVETYNVIRGMDAEVRLSSVGRTQRRRIFDEMFRKIDYQDYINMS
ncbi:hypothetical protein L5515_004920 [Caenorhabditis briggsae]|uniref:F-box domain-containing protein n=1 Tax=Caenorhabditis briggsae TaxID=6238 RepID=A0AAE9JE45_CAEBR|nr:hypothetical protein L5515_004920 [Caenorhabditis briggsae]